MAETAKKPNIFQRWARSFKDMRGELKKVVWPEKKQVLNNTGIVIIALIISACIIFLVSAAETIGDTSALVSGGLNREIFTAAWHRSQMHSL